MVTTRISSCGILFPSMRYVLPLIILFVLFACGDENKKTTLPASLPANGQELQPWSENPNWWSWDGDSPALLIGGSDHEAPFLSHDWKQELNYLKKTGGNYVMTSLPAYVYGATLFQRSDSDSGFKLNSYNSQYWKKLNEYLSYASDLGIAVEIMVWDLEGINTTPPDSLIWTSTEASPRAFGMLEGEFMAGEHPFFQTVPEAMGYRPEYDLMLTLQKGFVDQLLRIALPYRNVIYNVQVPETTDIPWMVYWGRYIEVEAKEQGLRVNVNLGIVPPARINVARFNRRLISGEPVAYHRPKPNGNGMNGSAQTSIRGARIVERHLNFWDLRPAPEILLDEESVASAATDGNGNYLMYLPGAGAVNLSPDWEEQVPVRVTVVGYLGTQKSELLQPPYGDSFQLFTEEAKGGWMILEPQ